MRAVLLVTMNFIPGLSWQDSDIVCALADSDRHLGHLIHRGEWYAYDATHVDESAQTFRCLGAFPDLASAKRTVELAVWAGDVHPTIQ